MVEHARGHRRPLPTECKARRGGRQSQQDDHDCNASLREDDNERQHHQQQQPRDRLRYWHTSRVQRQCDKQQKDLQDQQDGQARISEPILPGMKQCSLVVEDSSLQVPMHDGRFC
jgi:hypothetical protein